MRPEGISSAAPSLMRPACCNPPMVLSCKRNVEKLALQSEVSSRRAAPTAPSKQFCVERVLKQVRGSLPALDVGGGYSGDNS